MIRFITNLFSSSEKRMKREYADKFACYEVQFSEYGCSLLNLPAAMTDLAKMVTNKTLKECEVDSVLFRQKLEYHSFALTSNFTHMAELDYAGQELIVRYCIRHPLEACLTSANAIEQIIPNTREMGCTFYQAVEAAAVASHMTVEEVFGIHHPL